MSVDPKAETAIPQALRERDQWVVWRREQRNGKSTKVPYQPNGRLAACNEPATWSSYAAAVAVADRFDGIGYVFAADDPHTGVDFDDCLDGDGNLHPAVADAVKQLDTYTEWSPSGGIHSIAEATKNGRSRCRTRKTPWGGVFEVYDQDRYFTVTGDRLEIAPAAVQPRQAQLERLLEELLPPDGAKTASNGAGRRRKRRRVVVDEEAVAAALAAHPGLETLSARRGPDPSEDDYALACAAARDGLAADLIEQLVVHRLLRHGDPKGKATERDDYVPRTVERALAAVEHERRDEQLGDPLAQASGIIGMQDTPIVAAEERRSGVVVIDRSDGLVLVAPSLAALAKHDRLSAELAAGFGHELTVERGQGARTAVRFVAALRRHFGPMAAARAAERGIEMWMIELVRVAQEIDYRPGDEKASAWEQIDQAEPASTNTAPAFAAAVVLAHDTITHDRYLRASWAHEYLRRCGWRGSAEEAAALLEALGLEQPNADGRVRGGTLQFRFWVIPAGLFARWSA